MRPIILDFTVERTGERAVTFEYDFKESLNIIKRNGHIVPFVDSDIQNVELLTKTKVHRESDDDNFSVLELQTKTEINKERDDYACPLSLELETKTLVYRERGDENINYY